MSKNAHNSKPLIQNLEIIENNLNNINKAQNAVSMSDSPLLKENILKFNSYSHFEQIMKNKDTFLNRKRKNKDDKEFAAICNRNTKEDNKRYSDEKITDFFKLKKKLKYKNKEGNLQDDFKISDEELSLHDSITDSECKEKNLVQIPKNFSSKKKIYSEKGVEKSDKIPEKNIKDYFKEFKLSTKTLRTLKKGNFFSNIDSNSQLDCLISNRNSQGNIKQYKIKSHYCNDKTIKDIEKILNDLSMKQKYEELLHRELILPPIYKLLLLQFNFLDNVIIKLKFDKNLKTLLQNINEEAISQNFRCGISLEDFQKILSVTPILFLYKYDFSTTSVSSNKKNLKYDIIIDIPSDFEFRMKKSNSYPNTNVYKFQQLQSLDINKPIEFQPSTESLKSRSEFFKEILLHITRRQHDKLMKKKDIKFDPIKAGTWHSEFNLDEIQKIKNFNLFPIKEKKTARI